ncbi:MAG: hypothetical protein V4467_02980 [Patescibacteria group bacterium]
MSKKTAIAIIVFLVLLIAGGFLAFYFYFNRGTGNDIIPATNTPVTSIFPSSNVGGSNSGNNGGNNTSASTTISGNQNQSNSLPMPVLKQLSIRPSAGAVVIATTSPVVLVNFIEKGTGNVYQVSPENNLEIRLSNTTIPKIQEALWNKTGSQVITRYTTSDEVDSIKSYSGFLLPKSADNPDGALTGYFLSENIRAMVKNPDQNKIFYLLPTSSGSTGIIADFDGSKKTQIFDSLLKEWLVDWTSPNIISLNTKPSAGVPGYLFLLNTKTGGLSRAITGIKGLTSKVSPTGNIILYSESADGALSLKIYNLKTGTTLETPVATLAEKCVWSSNNSDIFYCAVPTYVPPGNFPDDWYKGLVLFSDEIWRIDSTTGTGELIADPTNLTKEQIDGVNLSLSPKEDYLLFTNKKDFHLWSLRLQQ